MSIDFRKRRAFTLLEIVLLVAILFLFILLLIPAFRTAKPLELTPEATPAPVTKLEPAATPAPTPPPPPKPFKAPAPAPEPPKPEPAPDNTAPEKPEPEKPAAPEPAPEPDEKPAANGSAILSAALDKELIARTQRKASRIIIPKLELREAGLRNAVEFLQRTSADLDPERSGMNVVLMPGESPTPIADRRITLSLSNVPMLVGMKYVAALAGCKVVTGPHPITIVPLDAPAPTVGQHDLTDPAEKEVAARIENKLATIIFPKLEMRDATFREAIDFLKKKIVDLDPSRDPAQRGVGIVVKLPSANQLLPADSPPTVPGLEPLPGAAPAPAPANPIAAEPKITLTLAKVSWMDAMQAVAAKANLKVVIEPYAVTLVPIESRNVASTEQGDSIDPAAGSPATAPEK